MNKGTILNSVASFTLSNILIKQIINIMGNYNQNQNKITALIDSHFISIRKFYHQVYAEITLLQHKNNTSYSALIEKYVDQPNQFQVLLEKNKNEWNKHMIKVQKWYSYKMEICSGIKMYYLIIEYLQNTIDKEIFLRWENRTLFKKQEALSLFSGIVEIVDYFQHNQMKINQFQISNKLFILSDRMEVKTINPDLLRLESGKQFYQLNYSQGSDKKYINIAPQVMLHLKQNENIEAYKSNQHQKARIFTIAMCFIQICLLVEATVFYNFQQKIIYYDKLSNSLSLIQNIYGQEIVILLLNMLRMDSDSRINLQQTKKCLKLIIENRKLIKNNSDINIFMRNNGQKLTQKINNISYPNYLCLKSVKSMQ